MTWFNYTIPTPHHIVIPHHFGQKTVKNGDVFKNPYFDHFLAKKGGSDLIWFEFCSQIWNPLIILHIIGTHLMWFSHLDFLALLAIFWIFKSLGLNSFCKLHIFFRIFGMTIVLCEGISHGQFKFWKMTQAITQTCDM